MKKQVALVLVCACFALTFSCGSNSNRGGERAPDRDRDTSSSQRGNGGGLWDMLANAERDKAARVEWEQQRDRKLRAQLAKGSAALPPAQRRNMINWWQEFIRMDPAWLEHRFEWRAYGQAAREILAENLIIAMVRAYSKNNGPIYKRARSELYDLSREATPYLVSGLADGRGDAVTRNHCVEMLGWYGKKAIPAITDAYGDAQRNARLDLLRAVKAMGPLGAPNSIPFLRRALDREDDFRLRLTAIQALGQSEDPSSIPLLIDCLEDDDVSIRKFGAGTLGHFKSNEAILALIELLERTERRMTSDNREGEVAANCNHSLRTMTGANYKRAAQWRRWWNRK